MAKALTPEQYERLRAQIAAYAGYACPDCLPVLLLEPDLWRFTVDHSPGCASHTERSQVTVDLDPEQQEQLIRELGWDKPPTREQLAEWQRWAEMTDAEFDADQGMTS